MRWAVATALVTCFSGRCAADLGCKGASCASDGPESDVSALLARKARVSIATDTSKTNAKFSLFSPDPSRLTWDKILPSAFRNMTVLHGWLKVPLSYDRKLSSVEKPPHVCLRVSAITMSETPVEGAMLNHCGGPNSGRDCPYMMMTPELAENYAMMGIDQRGIPSPPADFSMDENGSKVDEDMPSQCNFTEANGDLVRPFPAVNCDEIVASMANLTYSEQITAIKGAVARQGWGGEPSDDEARIIHEILSSSGPPADSVHGITIFNETYVRMYYRIMALEASLCALSERFEIKSPDGGTTYKMLSYAGTSDLAKDMNQLRDAIGMNKLTVYGGSYGTTVGAAYATEFPDHVGKLLLDGVQPPERELVPFFDAFSHGIFAVFQGIMTDCAQSLYEKVPEDERCLLAPGPSNKVMEMIQDTSNLERASAVYNLFSKAIFTIKWAPVAVSCAAVWHQGEDDPSRCPFNMSDWSAPPKAAPLIPCSAGGCSTSDRYGGDIFIATVYGMDMPGRFGEEGFISWWKTQSEQYPWGVARSLGVLGMTSVWPLNAKPLPPLGRGGIPALIVGNLHDAQTDYSGAQRMRAMFSDGAIMTWQGYGHGTWSAGAEPGTNSSAMADAVAIQLCKEWSTRYLVTGKLPDDGHVCMMDGPLNLGPISDNFAVSANDVV